MQKVKEFLSNVSKLKIFKIVVCVFGCLVVAILIFRAGMFAGIEKASFGENWESNYFKNFGIENINNNGENSGVAVKNFDNFPNPHGAVGKILKIGNNSIVVLDDKDFTEKNVIISSDTIIKSVRENISFDQLNVDDFVVIIGRPNEDGQIEAKLIRVMPDPSSKDVSIINNKFN